MYEEKMSERKTYFRFAADPDNRTAPDEAFFKAFDDPSGAKIVERSKVLPVLDQDPSYRGSIGPVQYVFYASATGEISERQGQVLALAANTYNDPDSFQKARSDSFQLDMQIHPEYYAD